MTEDTTDERSGDEPPADVQPTEQRRSDDSDRRSDDTGRWSDDTGRDGDDGDGHPDSDTDDQIPLSDLAGRVETRRAHTDVDGEPDELFEEVRVSELDSDDVWTALVGNEDDEDVGIDADVEPIDVAEGVSDHIVPKDGFCQRCVHFCDPPKLGCDHEGTTIVEVVDADHFRVRNCPMVGDDD